jgi:hypothetical protein
MTDERFRALTLKQRRFCTDALDAWIDHINEEIEEAAAKKPVADE